MGVCTLHRILLESRGHRKELALCLHYVGLRDGTGVVDLGDFPWGVISLVLIVFFLKRTPAPSGLPLAV